MVHLRGYRRILSHFINRFWIHLASLRHKSLIMGPVIWLGSGPTPILCHLTTRLYLMSLITNYWINNRRWLFSLISPVGLSHGSWIKRVTPITETSPVKTLIASGINLVFIIIPVMWRRKHTTEVRNIKIPNLFHELIYLILNFDCRQDESDPRTEQSSWTRRFDDN